MSNAETGPGLGAGRPPGACVEKLDGSYRNLRRGREQDFGIGILRSLRNLFRGSDLDNFAAIHYGDPR